MKHPSTNYLCKPMLMLGASLTYGSEASRGNAGPDAGIPEGTDPVQAVCQQMPEDAKKQMLEAADEKLSDMPESILTQAAVSGVKAEYEAMGEDLDAIQMNYIRELPESVNGPHGICDHGLQRSV